MPEVLIGSSGSFMSDDFFYDGSNYYIWIDCCLEENYSFAAYSYEYSYFEVWNDSCTVLIDTCFGGYFQLCDV
jgi:hypothetical protein